MPRGVPTLQRVYCVAAAIVLVIALLCVNTADAARIQHRGRLNASNRPSPTVLLEQGDASATVAGWSPPPPTTATCDKGPFRVSNLTIKPSASQKMTLAQCQGKRVQAAITSLTVAVADGRNVKVDTTVNGKSASIFSSSKASCFQKPKGVVTSPADGSGSVRVVLTCLDKKKPCKVNVAWSANCEKIGADDDDDDHDDDD